MWSYDVGSSIVDLKMSSSGQYVIVNSQLNGIFVFNTTSLTPDIPLWNFPMPNPSYQIDISLGGDFLVAGNLTSLWLFNILSPVPIWNVSMQVTSLAISGDGNFIVAGSYPHNISFFTKENNTPLWTYDVYDAIDSIEISNRGETFIIGSQSLYCFYRSVRGTGFLDVDMLDQIYSKEDFDIMFTVKDINGAGIDSASIQMWWNGTDVSSDIQNIGLGVYRVLLDPITVNPGELPILLNMSISASGYNDKYYETSLAVDPALLKSETPDITPSISGYNLLLLFSVSAVICIWIFRRKIVD